MDEGGAFDTNRPEVRHPAPAVPRKTLQTASAILHASGLYLRT